MQAVASRNISAKSGVKIMVRRTYIFDDPVMQKIDVIRKYMSKRFGVDTDTAAVKAAIFYFAKNIEEGKVE